MKQVLFWIPAICALALSLSSCGTGGHSDPYGPTAGPFDPVTGQYREDWADDPSKWRKPGGSPHATKTQPPQLAKNDEVPMNSIPLPPASGKPGTSPVGSTSKPIAVTQLPPSKKSETVVLRDTPKPTVKSATQDDDEDEPKKKVVKAKPKVKSKPKTERYTVKKGDSLSAIASRTGASVSAIKSANDISGTLIRPGQSLVIPRH